MIQHNLTLAWRQLMKYRLQSAVSIVSLAIGFACFALASMWIKYETTYDAFHKDAEKIHVITWQELKLCDDLVESCFTQFPEVELASHVYIKQGGYVADNDESEFITQFILHDSTFIEMFDIRPIEGSFSFLHNPQEMAISDQLARQMWGEESPLGKELKNAEDGSVHTVTAVFKDWGGHTSFPFEALSCVPESRGLILSGYAFLKLSEHTDLVSLNARIDSVDIPTNRIGGGTSVLTPGRNFYEVVPIVQLRHSTSDYKTSASIRVNHIYLFAIAGGILILCGLLNYLTMFINRLFIRQREIALRTVFGATGRNLMVQFLTEYGLLFLIAMFFGNYFLKLSLNWFSEMVNVPKDLAYVYSESFLYMSMVIVVSLLVSLPPIWYFRRQSLQNSITGVGGLTRYNLFRRFSTGIQLFIAILCIFCTVVLQKQIHTLRKGDLGFERTNQVSLTHQNFEEATLMRDFLKQLPEIKELITPNNPLFPLERYGLEKFLVKDFPELEKDMDLRSLQISEKYCQFYGLKLVEGRFLQERDKDCLLINETLAKKMGWTEPIGKEIPWKGKVVGVVKDFLNETPTMPAQPYMLIPERPLTESDKRAKWQSFYTVFTYEEGAWPALSKKIKEKSKKENWRYAQLMLMDVQQEYDRMLQSENNLQLLLTITTSVCILIALFGVWSMIMLTCEQRRKEIAIRKVFGATVKDILDMFFLEYMALQTVAALVAFPLGYACMKPWLEQYVVQTEISWWIYVGIFLIVALLVALCIGWRVWKTATARPADEICKG